MIGFREGALFAVKGLLSLAPSHDGPRASRFFRQRPGFAGSVTIPRSNLRQRSTLHRHRKPRFNGKAA